MNRSIPIRLQTDQYMGPLSDFQLFYHRVGGTIHTHWHEFYEMSLIVAGSGTHRMNGVVYRAEPGHTFLLTPADFHEIASDPGETIELHNLIFTERMVTPELAEQLIMRKQDIVTKYSGESYEEAIREYSRIGVESGNWREHSGVIVRGCIERLLVDLTRSIDQAEKVYKQDISVHPSIRKALVYVQNHFRNPLKLEEVARNVGLSANYFSESFSRQTGFTFQEYVRELRLQFARSLITATALPVTEICYAAGFNTLPYFERAFKAKYGMSPRRLRKQEKA